MSFTETADVIAMDRRLQPRTQVQFEAKVTNQEQREQSSVGRVCDMSETGISVVVPLQFAMADQVELEIADSLLLGRVVYSNPEGSQFRMGIEIQKVQLGNSGLSNLLQRTLMEAMPSVAGLEPVETSLS
jgi:hypothetical protein